MKEKRTVRINSLFSFFIQFVVVAALFFAIGFSFGQKKIEVVKRGIIPRITVSNQVPPDSIDVDFSLMWEVLETLPKTYLNKDDITGQNILYGAISGMVRSLGDPYTAFFDPKQNNAVTEELAGSYEGIGIQIGFNDQNRLVVIAPLKGTPAEAAGLQAKDLILKVDDRETLDITLPEAVELIRGPAGSEVVLSLAQEGETDTYEATIARAKITVKSVEVEYMQADVGEIAVIKVSRFGDTTDGDWDKVVAGVVDRNVEGVIVDMRNNPGGLLTSSVHLSSEFVSGVIVKQEYSNGKTDDLRSDHSGRLSSVPLVVLVNQGSASAAEIFAGAIKDNKRGKIIGEKTFGKGTVQDVVDLKGGSSLHVTIARWLTPKGKSIHKSGIEPDITVERSRDDIKNEIDPQLERALEEI